MAHGDSQDEPQGEEEEADRKRDKERKNMLYQLRSRKGVQRDEEEESD